MLRKSCLAFLLCSSFLIAVAADQTGRGAGAQDAGGRPAGEAAGRREADAPDPPAASPYEIARVVNESADVGDMGRAGAAVDLTSTWRGLKIEPGEFASCEGDCEAEASRHELDGGPGKEVVLKLTKSAHWCRYLIFSRADGGGAASPGWKLLGFVDHDFNKYEMSSHSVVRAGRRSWLVVRGQAGSGSGFSLYLQTWYEVGGGGVRPVLCYYSSGVCYGGPDSVGRTFDSQIVAPRLPSEDQNAFTVSYSITYEFPTRGDGDEREALDNRHRVRYVWDGGRREFVFDAQRSDISEDEIAAAACAEDPEVAASACEVFLKYNLKSLLSVAGSGEAESKDWLRRYVKECPESPEGEVLSAALGGKKRRPAARAK